MDSEELAGKLSESYSTYLKVDSTKQMEKLEESIEETLTRLEELENGIKMLQAQRERAGDCDLTAARKSLSTLCQKVHKLDELSKRVLQDVEALEPVVDEAEVALTTSPEGRLKTILKPFFFNTAESTSSSQSLGTSQFNPQPHFKTASLFPKENEKKPSS